MNFINISEKIKTKINELNSSYESHKIIIDSKEFEINIDHFYDFDQHNFIHLKPKNIFFIDSGNKTIISNNNINIQYIKFGYLNLFFDSVNSKFIEKSIKVFNGIIITTLIKKKDVYNYQAEYIPINNNLVFKKIIFNKDDPVLYYQSDKPNKVSEIFRNTIELNVLSNLINENINSIIIRDGSLDLKTKPELELIDKIKENIKIKQGQSLFALSKTSQIFTDNCKDAKSVLDALSKRLNKNKWFYLVNDNLVFVKFNERSKFIFKVDFLGDIHNIFYLFKNSQDVIFLGYPYGLVKIDSLVRIRNEHEILKALLINEIYKDNINPHDILNMIK